MESSSMLCHLHYKRAGRIHYCIHTQKGLHTCSGSFLGWVRLDMFLAGGSFISDFSERVNKRLCVCVCVYEPQTDRLKRWAREIYVPLLRSMMEWMWNSDPLWWTLHPPLVSLFSLVSVFSHFLCLTSDGFWDRSADTFFKNLFVSSLFSQTS